MEMHSTDQLQAELFQIMDKELTAANISSYADEALDELVVLKDKVASSFIGGLCIESAIESQRELEDKAFQAYGMPNIDELLDHIASVSENMSFLDEIIDSCPTEHRVFIKPNGEERIAQGPGESRFETRTVERTKATLFILARDFGVDLSDPEQFTIRQGKVTEDIVRGHSYRLISAHKLQRTILVCDEVGNATYVINTEKLAEQDISADDLINMDKKQLNALLSDNPYFGQRVIDRNNFPGLLRGAIEEPVFTNKLQEKLGEQYLIPKAPEGYFTKTGLSKLLGIETSTLDKVIEIIGDDIGEVARHIHGPRSFESYSPEQIQKLTAVAIEHRYIAPETPRGYASITKIAETLGIAREGVRRRFVALEDELGEIEYHKYNGKVSESLNPRQIIKILGAMRRDGLFLPDLPEDHKTISSLQNELGTTHSSISGAIKELFGENTLPRFKSRGRPFIGLNEEQVQQLAEHLVKRGIIGSEAPEGYKNMLGLSKEFGVAPQTINKIMEQIEDQLDEPTNHKFGNRATRSYSPKDIELIRSALAEQGFLAERAPEGYTSIQQFVKETGISTHAVRALLTEYPDEIGDIMQHKYGSKLAASFSPAQQATLRRLAEGSRFNTTEAPEGYYSVKGLSEFYSVNEDTIRRAISRYEDEIGEVVLHRHGPRPVPSYSPEQQKFIESYLRQRGLLA